MYEEAPGLAPVHATIILPCPNSRSESGEGPVSFEISLDLCGVALGDTAPLGNLTKGRCVGPYLHITHSHETQHVLYCHLATLDNELNSSRHLRLYREAPSFQSGPCESESLRQRDGSACIRRHQAFALAPGVN